MPLPNLIHPVDVAIEVLDTGSTIFDPDAREPIHHAARAASVVVKGQPRWTAEAQLSATALGPTDNGLRGYVLFRYVDLAAAGITLKKNDRITMQGQRYAEVYIDRLQPMGYYPATNGASLVRAWVTDRKPAKER